MSRAAEAAGSAHCAAANHWTARCWVAVGYRPRIGRLDSTHVQSATLQRARSTPRSRQTDGRTDCEPPLHTSPVAKHVHHQMRLSFPGNAAATAAAAAHPLAARTALPLSSWSRSDRMASPAALQP